MKIRTLVISFIAISCLYLGYQLGYLNVNQTIEQKNYDDMKRDSTRELINMLVLINHIKPTALDGIRCDIESRLSSKLSLMKLDVPKRVGDWGADEKYAKESIEYVEEFITNYLEKYPTSPNCVRRTVVSNKDYFENNYEKIIWKLDPWTNGFYNTDK